MADTYTISSGDYNALRAMLTHEGQSTILNDIAKGNTNSAYGQLTGLVETWLNRAAASGLSTNGLQGLMQHPQVSFFPSSQSGVNSEAGQLDPRIGQMLNTYLQSRNAGDPGILGSVNQYLNKDLTDALYSQNYRQWYDKSQLLGSFGDLRDGGKSSLQQQFLNNPTWNVPEYSVSVDPRVSAQFAPTEGDVNALDDFRNTFRLPTPLPPGRPTDGSAGIIPRGADQGVAGGALDRMSDSLTQGLQSAGNTILDTFQRATGRLPSVEELQQRFNDLQSGASNLYDQITGIAKSDEAKAFAQKTGIDPNQYVLNDIYRLGLGRDVDAGSASGQMDVLRNQGAQSLYNQITNSQEGRTYALGNFYQNNFGRDIDQGGLSKYLNDLAQGKTLQSVETQILSSPEAQARGITPDQFASLINPDLYGTSTLSAGQNNGTVNTGTQVGTIGAGPDVGTIGPGGLTPTIDDYYNTILQRAPDPTGLASYQGQITNGVPANLVQAQILASPEATQTLGPDRLTQLVNDYQTQYGIKPQDAATLAPFASEFAQLLGRPADTPTIQYWDQQIQAGLPLGAIEAQIIAAPEVQQARSASLDGVTNAFQTKYGLNPTEAATLSPSSADYAKLIGPGADVGTVGAGPAVNTLGAGPAIGTLGPGFTVDTLQGALTGTVGAGQDVGTIGAGPTQQAQPVFTGAFDPNAYLAANQDVAAAHVDPLTHYLTFGFNEGRAIDTQGDRINRAFDPTAYLNANQDVKAAGMDPLAHYIEHGAQEGRALPTGTNPYSFTNFNASQGFGSTGNGTFSGTFDPAQYLAVNKDVAASGMDPLTHYLTYGFNEGRALDTAGDKINQGFDPNAYLAQNQDVAASKMDPLAHYLEYGAHEGRALPTGTNPYSFSNFNVAQGLGAGNGSFGLSGVTGGGGGLSGVSTASGPSNALGGSGGASGSAFGYTDAGDNPQVATFNPQQSELSYLQGQVNQNNQMIAAGQQGTANNPNLANAALFNLGAQVQAQQINGVNPALAGALPTGIGTTTTNVGTQVAPGTYTTGSPIINIGTPVLPGGLNAINGFGGPLNGGVSFGGHGGFFHAGGAVTSQDHARRWPHDAALIALLNAA